MLYFLTEILFKFLWYFILITIAYNVFLCIRYYRYVTFSWNSKDFFKPCLPFIGNTYLALFAGKKVNILSTVILGEKYFGMPYTFWVGHKYHYMTDNAEEARIVLNHTNCLNKAQMYDGLKCIFANSLLLVPAEKWKPRRKYLRSAFKPNMLKSFATTFYQQSCVLIDEIKTMAPQDDLFKFFNKYAFMNFILTSAGSDNYDCQPIIDRFGIFDSIADDFVTLLLNPICPAALWMKTPAGRSYKKKYDEITDLMIELLQYKKQQRTEEYIENPGDTSLIDLLLAQNKRSDIVNELIFFGGAATDTTGHTLAFCFTLLGMHPDVQQQVYEEVMAIVGDRCINIEDVPGLKYTEMVVCETLRIFPPVPFFARYCDEDVNIGTKVAPKGCNIVVNAYHLHRRADYWKNPLKFDPLRFSPENMANIVPGSFVPFSAGPRNCLGEVSARIVLKITVANVIRNYQITSNHKSVAEFSLESCISLKTLDPLYCKFIPRDY